MCLSPRAYVELKVYVRLVESGVREAVALGVARKVGRAYDEKRKRGPAKAPSVDQPEESE